MAKCSFGLCPFNPQANGFCIKHQSYATTPLPKKEKSRINPMAAKRKTQHEIYRVVKAKHLKENPFCQICPIVFEYIKSGGEHSWVPVCGKVAVEVHHPEGRDNERLYDSNNMLSSCDSKKFNNGHRWLDQHSEAAMKIGIILTRLTIKKTTMAKSDYSYKIVQWEDKSFISIVDRCLGRMSVTNNIENVLDEIYENEQIEPGSLPVVYQDSDGNWDGYDYQKRSFIILHCDTESQAIQEYLKL